MTLDPIAVGAAILTAMGVVFGYVVLPQHKRQEAWNIIGWLVLAALTGICLWMLKNFAADPTPPTRADILYAIIFTIGAMSGWGSAVGLAVFHLSYRSKS